MGQLAEKKVNHGDVVSGILVKQNFTHRIISPADLSSHTNLQHGLITPRVVIPFSGTPNQILRHLLYVCQDVEVMESDPSGRPTKMKVCKSMTVTVSPGMIALEWTYNRFSNMLADTLSLAILTMPEDVPDQSVDVPPYNLESHFYEELMMVLNDMFGKDCIDPTSRKDQVHLIVDHSHITIDIDKREVTCDDPLLHKSLTNVVKTLNGRDLTRSV